MAHGKEPRPSWQRALGLVLSFVVVGCASGEDLAEPVGTSAGIGAYCDEPVQMSDAVDGRYAYGTNNCHHHANCFAERRGRSGTVQCQGDVVGSYAYHTVNITPDPAHDDGSHFCIVEPQNGASCCFEQPNGQDTCGNFNVDLSGGAGGACAAKMCRDQYQPRQCRVLSPAQRAKTIQDTLDACVDNAGDRASCVRCCITEELALKEMIRGWCDNQPSPYDDSGAVYQASRACTAGCDRRFPRTPPPPEPPAPTPSPSSSPGS